VNGDSKAKTVETKPEVSPETLADAVAKISTSMQKLLKSGLNKKAIVTLVKDDTNIPKHTIEQVLDSLKSLKERYCK